MLEDYNIYEKSNPDFVIALGKRFRDYRLMSRNTQKEVSEKAGVSVFTIRAFETGRAMNITMSNFIALLRAIGYLEEIEKLLPPLPIDPQLLLKLQKKSPKRVRHGK